MILAQTWFEALQSEGHTLKSATAHLNDALGTRHSTSRVCEWRKGSVPVPAPVRAYMLEYALFQALRAEGVDVHALSDQSWARIVKKIS